MGTCNDSLPKLDRATWSNDFLTSFRKIRPPSPPPSPPPPAQITLRAVSLLQECEGHHRRGSDSCQLTGPAMQPIRKRQETDCGCIGPTGLSGGAGGTARSLSSIYYLYVRCSIPTDPVFGAVYWRDGPPTAAHRSICSRDQARGRGE